MKTYFTRAFGAIVFLFMVLCSYPVIGQVAVTDMDGSTPDNSAVLDVISTTRGMLIPRLTETQMNAIVAPAQGLLVFNTNQNSFYFFDAINASWVELASSGKSDVWTKNSNGIVLNDITQKVGIGTTTPLSMLEVKGDASVNIDDPLFEVKNNNNETVFAVYREGVRMYIADGNEKGTKGGFAIGSLSGKSENNYLIVSPDSSRIYVNERAAKGTKGGFAIGSLATGKAGSASFMHLTPDNYFIGHQAGSSITSGLYNSFMGYQSGFSTTDGSWNVFLGNATGYSNVEGYSNTFIGNEAGMSNTGGYANVFIGDQSGYANDTGVYNIFMGRSSGYSNTAGDANIIIGDYAGVYNTIGSSNVFIGDYTGASNVDGENNIFLGASSGWTNTSGSYNVFMGSNSGFSNTTGNWNVFMGENSGYSNTIGVSNLSIGKDAGYNNTEGNYNVFLGTWSGKENITGSKNVFVGQESGLSNTAGDFNAFLGMVSGYSNTTGISNVYLGNSSGYSNTEGSYNVSVGTYSGYSNMTGEANVYIGQQSGQNSTSGDNNVYVGSYAGANNLTGSWNVFLGYGAGYSETGSDKLYIENNYEADKSTALVYGDFAADLLRFNAGVSISGDVYSTSALTVWGDAYSSVGWFYPSDLRFKKNISVISDPIAKLKEIRGVTYNYKTDEFPDMKFSEEKQVGIIAQELEKVVPEVVSTDEEGYKSVDYARITPLLIEAFKEQQNQIDALTKLVEKLDKENSGLRKSFVSLKSDMDKLSMPDHKNSKAAVSGPTAQ